VQPHAGRRQRERLRDALPLLFAEVDAVHCVSDSTRRAAVALGLPPGKAWLIPQAVDSDFFRPPARPRPLTGEFRLVTVGTLRWVKGQEYALVAVAQLADDGVPVRLEIVGGEPSAESGEAGDRQRLAYTIADLGLEDRVTLCGVLEPAEIRTRLQRADAYLHLSLSEGLPNAVLEAMACGLPVVASDAGGTAEAVRDGVEGLLVPPRDAAAAAAALRTLWEERALRERLGAAARERALGEFRPQRETDAFVELYDALLAGARA
jgi:glycosyltransferase involved in cell wall biosynthesis